MSTASHLPVTWSETENVAWKTAIPGRGWSTPIIADGKVWVTAGLDTPAAPDEAAERRKTSSNSQPLTISDTVTLHAYELDLKTGELLRDIALMTQVKPQMIHIENSYASPSPIWDNGKLYCHFGPSGLACLDVASGEVLWTKRDLYVKHENGAGSTPVLWNHSLIVHCDGIDQQYIVAIDCETGKELWRAERTGELHENPQLRKSYATPLVTELNGRTQVLSPAADWLYGYDPATGQELWRMNYGRLGFSNSAPPLLRHGLVYICTGYMQSNLLAVRVAPDGDGQSASLAWDHTQQVPSVSSPIIVGDELYMASDRGIASCLDAKTGKVHWRERIGSKFWASPFYADGRLYFLDHQGDVTVVAPGRVFQKLATNHLEGILYASAAAVDNALVLRTDQAVYCLRLP